MFKKILIANRGEIACRIARSCRRIGIAVATIHSEADRDALHVREIGESIEIGPAPATDSYLAVERIVAAARKVGANAVHPGYGFLAENVAFAAALEKAGIAFIGPTSDVLTRFGDKAAAKAEAISAGVPVVPGSQDSYSSVEDVLAAVSGMSMPLLLKAAAGGGGKGMRVVSDIATLRADVEAAMREGRSAFGDPRLIVESYLPEPRHVEVQILGDGQGGVLHLFDRECSLQRRHQKVIEEAPVTSLPEQLRNEILDHAVRLCKAVRYRGLGTVEFIVREGAAYFLEVNPRIQVEHPVTEEILGLDLVELQIRAVSEGRLPMSQEDVVVRGVAVEARLYAEDPDNRFLPSTGTIESLIFPAGLRIDTGVDAGSAITPHYDPMIAKLITWGEDRPAALSKLRDALEETSVLGVTTNLGFLRTLAANTSVLANSAHTGTIDAIVSDEPAMRAVDRDDIAVAAALWLSSRRSAACGSPWSDWSRLTGWRLRDGAAPIAQAPAVRLSHCGVGHEVRFGALTDDGCILVAVGDERCVVRIGSRFGNQTVVSVDGRAIRLAFAVSTERVCLGLRDRNVEFVVEPYLSGALLAPIGAVDGRVRAPMMGQIVAIDVQPGDAVAAGMRLGLMESMKMELTLAAPIQGVVTEIGCRSGATVERDQVVFVIVAS